MYLTLQRRFVLAEESSVFLKIKQIILNYYLPLHCYLYIILNLNVS